MFAQSKEEEQDGKNGFPPREVIGGYYTISRPDPESSHLFTLDKNIYMIYTAGYVVYIF